MKVDSGGAPTPAGGDDTCVRQLQNRRDSNRTFQSANDSEVLGSRSRIRGTDQDHRSEERIKDQEQRKTVKNQEEKTVNS